MPESRKILVIDDDEDVLIAASMLLKKKFGQVRTLKDPGSSYQLLKDERFDAVLLDMNFTSDTTSGNEGLLHLKNILELCPGLPVILITAYGSIELAVRGLKQGAFDFILKPWKNDKLLETVSSALKVKQAEETASHKSIEETESPDQITGDSEGMKEVSALIRKLALTDTHVLISGEAGSGRELAARELHRRSSRATKPFVSMDLALLTETSFARELFGYVKGAFPEAREDHKGKLEAANGGTLFLDGISNLSLPMQSTLLHVMQEMKSRPITTGPLGSGRQIPVNVRFICSTVISLTQLLKEGKFRQDLLFRINTVEIHLPSLRYRGNDIYLLADQFLQTLGKKYKRQLNPLSAEVKYLLKHYNWPGNVRELKQRMERAMILSEGPTLSPEHFQLPETKDLFPASQATMRIAELEREAIMRVMKKNAGNITHAAKELGLSRAALYRRIEKYDL